MSLLPIYGEVPPGRAGEGDEQICNAIQHGSAVSQDLVGGYAVFSEPTTLEPCRPGLVMLVPEVVRWSIDFDYQALGQTREIGDIGPDRSLAPELEAEKLASTEPSP